MAQNERAVSHALMSVAFISEQKSTPRNPHGVRDGWPSSESGNLCTGPLYGSTFYCDGYQSLSAAMCLCAVDRGETLKG